MISKSIPLINKLEILGVRVDEISLDQLIREIIQKVKFRQKKAVVANVNVHAIMLALKLNWLNDFLRNADLVFCDGYGVKWATKLILKKKLHRLTYMDWFGELASECARNQISLYFLGTKQEIVEKAANQLRTRFADLRILGVHHGFFSKDYSSSDNLAVINEINSLKPNVLLVGFGMPAQEKWISENLGRLDVNIIMPSGAYFDYLAGEIRRAPKWMTDHGLEWLGRLIIEPRRLWKRYLFEIPRFVYLVFREAYTNKYHRKEG